MACAWRDLRRFVLILNPYAGSGQRQMPHTPPCHAAGWATAHGTPNDGETNAAQRQTSAHRTRRNGGPVQIERHATPLPAKSNAAQRLTTAMPTGTAAGPVGNC